MPIRRRLAPRLLRSPVRQLSSARVLKGGRPADLGRLPRYAVLFVVGAACIWVPIGGYLATAPLRFTSDLSLILPGAGASASVNLDQIGQASSFASSPYASSSVSPTETYKRLIGAERILDAAARSVGRDVGSFGAPRVELVDQTGLIHVSMVGDSAADAKARVDALLSAFFAEIEALRADELQMRESGAGDAIEEYRLSVLATRDEISRLQRETGLTSAAQYQSLVADADALATRVQDVAATLHERARGVQALEASLGLSPRLASAALRLHADPEFGALAAEMAARAAELSEARGSYGENHPVLRTALAEHGAAREAVDRRAEALTGLLPEELAGLDLSHVGDREGLLSDLVTLEAERAGLQAQHETLSAQLSVLQARSMALIEPAARLEDLQRDFSVAEAVFASAMARTQTNKADLFASYPLVQVLENPSLPSEPTSPKRELALAAGVAATLFHLIGLALGWLRRPLIDRLLAPGTGSDPTRGLVPAE